MSSEEKRREACVDRPVVSRKEARLAKYLKGEGVRFRQSVRDLLEGYEVDIYLPDVKVGIEVNSAYYHNTCHKDPEYHWRKSSQALAQGFTLYHVWDETPVYWVRGFCRTLPVKDVRPKGQHMVYHHPYATTYYQYNALAPSRWGDSYIAAVDSWNKILGMACYEVMESGSLDITAYVVDPRYVWRGLPKFLISELTKLAWDLKCHCITFRCSGDYFPRQDDHPLSGVMQAACTSSYLEPMYYTYQQDVPVTYLPKSGDEMGLPTMVPRLGRTVPRSVYYDKGVLQVVGSGFWDYLLFV